MSCPDCERFKASAAMWRNKAYELGGTPLPWDADEMIRQAVLAERNECAKIVDGNADGCTGLMEQVLRSNAAAIRARGIND